MQTFVPSEDLLKNFDILDYRRLGKQRVEGKQILWSLLGYSSGWINHPATRMWRGYEESLANYIIECCLAWRDRGFKDNIADSITAKFSNPQFTPPSWWGGVIHSTHRSNLLRKDPIYYSRFEWTELPLLPYWWPV